MHDLAEQLRALVADVHPNDDSAAAEASDGSSNSSAHTVALNRFGGEVLDHMQEMDPKQLCSSLRLTGPNAVYNYLPAMASLMWGQAAVPENCTVYMSDRMPGQALVAERHTQRWEQLDRDAVLGRCVEAVTTHYLDIEGPLQKALSPAKFEGLMEEFNNLEDHVNSEDLPSRPRNEWPQALQTAAKAIEHVLVKACRDRRKPMLGRTPVPPKPVQQPPPPPEEDEDEGEGVDEEQGPMEARDSEADQLDDEQLYTSATGSDLCGAEDDTANEVVVLSIF